MKGILNVLYRRILYKIPLKFLLLLLCIGALLFASCNAGYENISRQTITFSSNQTYFELISNGEIFCIMPYQNLMDGNNFKIAYLNGGFDNNNNLIGNVYAYNTICFNESVGIQYNGTAYSSNKLYLFSGFSNLISSCDYSGYILESSIDSIYCLNNNLCPVYTGECENSSGVNWSSLYINNIQHIGGPNIYIDIPEELSRDYDYTDEDMYIDIEGYNVDYDKITGIINTQNYKPTNEDFNYIVSSVIPLFVPGLVIILFLYWIFRFIKKIF